MEGGVFRSGELGPYATLDSNVKVVTDTDNFFDTRFEEEDAKQAAIDFGRKEIERMREDLQKRKRKIRWWKVTMKVKRSRNYYHQ